MGSYYSNNNKRDQNMAIVGRGADYTHIEKLAKSSEQHRLQVTAALLSSCRRAAALICNDRRLASNRLTATGKFLLMKEIGIHLL